MVMMHARSAYIASPMFVLPTRIRSRRDWLEIRVTALALYGDDDADRAMAGILGDYITYQLEGQDGYDIGGES